MKPMLSATVENIEQLSGRYPLYASPKLDGIRALVVDNVLVSRNLKPIPNLFVQNSLPLTRMNGWDGELIVGKPEDKNCFRNTTSGVMSVDGEPNFTFWVFDHIPAGNVMFYDRFEGLKANVRGVHNPRIRLVPHIKVSNSFEVHTYEEIMLERGFEGIMLRTPTGEYKYGRSTLKEGHLMKLKQFADSEALVLGLAEQLHNGNEKKMNELGKMQRSSHKAGKTGKGTLGALEVRDIHTGVEFDVGTGLDDETRRYYWDHPLKIVGKVIKYKYFPTGSKAKPRFPVYTGIRHENDQ